MAGHLYLNTETQEVVRSFGFKTWLAAGVVLERSEVNEEAQLPNFKI